MDILITGNVHLLGSEFYKKIGVENKVVVCGKLNHKENSISNATIYNRELDEEEYENVFKTFHFHTVIYISKAVDGARKVFDELESLESTLYNCNRYDVPNMIYVAANDYIEGTHQNSLNSSRHVLINACENLCYTFSQENKKNVLVLRIPYLYNLEHLDHHLGEWIDSALKTKQVFFPGEPDDIVDFLWDCDLANLLLKILDNPTKNYYELNISGKSQLTFSEIENYFRENMGGISVECRGRGIAIPQASGDSIAREMYGWFPLANLSEHICDIVFMNQNDYEHRNRVRFLKSLNPKIRWVISISLELIVLFLLANALERWLENNTLLNFVDFKLLIVVIMGTIHGLNIGIIAAIIACISYATTSLEISQWQVVFYNVQNWLPYATYLLVGGISGYSNDKKKDELSFYVEEQKVLEDKYVFLTEIYQKAIDNNKEFMGQIVGYKDSFGKMYSVIKSLESTFPDRIFLEAVQVLEEMMDNRTVAIYSVEKESMYARLVVCSKYSSNTLSKSINLANYPVMFSNIKQGNAWVNIDGYSDYPDYGMPIMHNGFLSGLIFLNQVSDKQMNLEYSNKFSIISGLIKDSLIRASEWIEIQEKDTMIPNTRILMADHFSKVVEARNQMRQKEVSEYSLLRLICQEMDFVKVSSVVTSLVRSNDVLGLGADGFVYLLLSQTGDKYISIIAQRLEKNNITFETVK